MEIPDGSMVLGAPARIKRALDEETRQFLLTVAGGYRDNALRYLAELETTA